SEEVLATNSGYALYQHANAYRAEYGDRLVQVGFENGVYFFRGTVIGDWFGPGRYRDLLGCESLPCTKSKGEILKQALHRHDAHMIMVSQDHVPSLEHVEMEREGWVVLAVSESGVLLGLSDGHP